MSQESLFNARLYLRQAYESLVLAYAAHELQEVEALKNAVFRGMITVENIALEHVAMDELTQSEIDVPF